MMFQGYQSAIPKPSDFWIGKTAFARSSPIKHLAGSLLLGFFVWALSVAEAVTRSPEKSDRAIAEEIGVSGETVRQARAAARPRRPRN